MPLIDSQTGEKRQTLSIEELISQSARMRALNLISLCAAGSGHSGGTLGVMDIAAALYLRVARHDPENPDWDGRDRIIWSAGHKAPAIYTAMAVAGFLPEEELMTLRQLGGRLQGHPHWRDLPGLEFSTGSLGQGLSIGVGAAQAARLDKQERQVFVISSDGDLQEGSHWEAVMAAAAFHLDNLVSIVDRNRLQIDGPVGEVMPLESVEEKYRAFGWEVFQVDGHNMEEIVAQLEATRTGNPNGRPIALICDTVKGKGVSFMENQVGWHGKPPNREELDCALSELGQSDAFDVDSLLKLARDRDTKIEADLDAAMPNFKSDFWWNNAPDMKVDMKPTRRGFGRALDKYGDDERVVCIGADISDSICISDFYKEHPERRERFISVGVAEQNATTVAAGLAREGKLPVFGTYGVFSSTRNLDQLRVSVCYGNLNVLVVGAHGGISVGPDGATHQELEALFQIPGLPNMNVAVPCDALETERATKALLFDVVGPKYLRFAREATPVITTPDTPYSFGEGLIFRFREKRSRFVDAFESFLASDYRSENELLTLISCGPETTEALRAAYILKTDLDIETRVLHLGTIKPLDREAIIRSARETTLLITAEEHQVGGLGNRVAAVMAEAMSGREATPKFAMLGVPDRFGESGKPWQLIKKFGLAGEHIARRAIELLKA